MSKGVFVPLNATFDLVLAGKRGGPDPLRIGGAKTPNMRMGKCAMSWAWAVVNRLGSDAERARELDLLEYFALQERCGMQCVTDQPRTIRWGDESFTASHHYTWSKWVWGLIALGIRLDQPEVLAAATAWIEGQLAVWNLVDRSRTGTLAIAGARCGGEDGDDDRGGKDGIDSTGQRIPWNLMRDLEWKSCLKALGLRPGRVRSSAVNLALAAGYRPRLDGPLPHTAQPFVIRHHGDGSASTSFPDSPPGQGGAQHVLQRADGTWTVLEAERTDDVTQEWRAA